MLDGIAQQLVSRGALDREQAQQLSVAAQQEKCSFLQYAISQQSIAPKVLAAAAAHEFGIPLLDLAAFDRELLPRNLVNEHLIRRHGTLPLFQRDKSLYIAIANPASLEAVDEIQFQTGLHTQAVLVPHDQLARAVEAYLEGDEEALAHLEDAETNTLELSEQEHNTPVEESANTDDAPIVRFVNKVLLDAIKMGSSDIHLEPYERNFRIRYRTDGLLHEVVKPPFNLRHRITSRLKVMAHLDIAERRIPQDGSIKLKVSKARTIDFRVNTLPTLWGEKVVLRILDSSAARIAIDQLGFSPEQKRAYQTALSQPQGMILVTGPTGSGKTVTLYSGLNILNTPERNISTAEDPVEINLEGINQVNVNPKVGLNFAAALRAFLRQDPDIVMVGEIRDLETAEISIKAAQTGHLVLSTLHTNSATETLTRLSNMGIPAFNIATSVSLIIAQRLARKLCVGCKIPVQLPDQVLMDAGFLAEELPELALFEATGCEQCNNGYKGRIGIYEVLPISPAIVAAILTDANALDITRQAHREGFINIRTAGLEKVRSGQTSLTEINRVTLN